MLWILFFIFLVLIVSPVDLAPGPIDDIIYGIFDVVIVAMLGISRDKKKALPLSEEGESAEANDER